MNRAVFLDRDGVINRKAPEDQYITRWEDFEFLPGSKEAIASLNAAGYRVIVVTNQRCVAKRLLTIPELETLHKRMCSELAVAGAPITAIYYCPHDKEPACECRKPSPSMILAAARDHYIDLHASWMVGDSVIDIEAGRRAGCKTLLITGGASMESGTADITARSLFESIPRILGPSFKPPTGREMGG